MSNGNARLAAATANLRRLVTGTPGPLFAGQAADALPAPIAPPRLTSRPEGAEQAATTISGPSPLKQVFIEDTHAAAERIVRRATRGLTLSKAARRFYTFLVTVAVGNARTRKLKRLPDVAELHLPAELLALLMDVRRETVWRWAEELAEQVNLTTGEVTGAQLLARKDHKCTSAVPIAAKSSQEAQHARRKAAGGGTPRGTKRGVSDGLVWAVSLTGPRPGLQVSADALRHEWRDLAADSYAAAKNKGTPEGLRTVWEMKNQGLQQSLKGLKATEEVEIAVRWTVNPGLKLIPPSYMTVAGAGVALDTVWDVQSVRGLARHEQARAVDTAAQFLAALYGDSGSLSLYHWILWRMLRLDLVGVNLWQPILTLMQSLHGDQRDGDVDKAGSVLMYRLKLAAPGQESLWSLLKRTYELAPRTTAWAS